MFDLHFPEIIFIFFLLALLVFEIAMFVDAYKNPKLTANSKLLWMVGMVLVHPFVAIVYWFMYRKNRRV